MSYNPYLPPFYSYGVTPANPPFPTAPPVEDVIDPTQFKDIELAARFTPGHFGEKIDIAFHGMDLAVGDDFFRYLGTDAGLLDLGETVLVALVNGGVISYEAALGILNSW